jgi:hypothetical protein
MIGWVPLDKRLIKTLPDDRPYSYLEAMFSFTVNENCGHPWTIAGYAKRWQWSRNKVRKFVEDIRTGSGHLADRKGTGKGHPITFIDLGSRAEEDRLGTGRGQEEDRKRTLLKKQRTKKEITTDLSGKPSDVEVVFSYWQEKMNHPKARLAGKREKAIKNSLKHYSVEDLKTAIDGCLNSPHHMGKNDRGEKYDDIELICRDSTKTDRFIELARLPGKVVKIGGYTFD